MLAVKLARICAAALSVAGAISDQFPLIQKVADARLIDSHTRTGNKQLKGRFLHITDIHPDPFYKVYSSSERSAACHKLDGPAGYWGAETSDCDSPLAVVNATFDWIEENLRDEIDFVIWTGDSARHDNDEAFPRTVDSVKQQNQFLVDKFMEVFGVGNGSRRRLSIPVVPSFGNNDVLPHNLFFPGPNQWTKAYSEIWRPFIPEEQRHAFDRGGWFYVEVIPNRLAVFSLNTMYFFDANTAVDGCASASEPGYEHLEWLRIQLEFLRQRGMKAILSGHVPPARNEEKVGWDETCWQKYTIWMLQYRDVVVGSMYGHMNLEHFILQDFEDIDLAVAAGLDQANQPSGTRGSVTVKLNSPEYLHALRQSWSQLPRVPANALTPAEASTICSGSHVPDGKSDTDFCSRIGGRYAERFAVSFVSASIVPNFYSSLRVYDYNITNLANAAATEPRSSVAVPLWEERQKRGAFADERTADTLADSHAMSCNASKFKHSQARPTNSEGRKPGPTRSLLNVPDPPPLGAPPGPAYSPQALSLLGYTQFFANNTFLNNDLDRNEQRRGLTATGWNPGRFVDRRPGKTHSSPSALNFTFEVEYDTQTDEEWRLGHGLSVVKWVIIASRIGEYEPHNKETACASSWHCRTLHPQSQHGMLMNARSTLEAIFNVLGLRGWKARYHRLHNEAHSCPSALQPRRGEESGRDWFAFCSRAVVGTMDPEELHETFG